MEFVVIPLALLLIAGLLLRRGWVGRTIGDHPVCRRCGFDLFGLPEGGQICSECGGDLTLRKAIRTGHREHRGGLLGAGGFLLLIVVAWVGVVGVAFYSEANLQPYKPTWYLAREMRSPDAATRDAALAEVTARFGAGKLSQAQIDSFVEQGLAFQGDRSRTWDPAWGDWIEAVQAKGMLSNERWQRYLEQAVILQLKYRGEIRRGDRLPYQVNHLNARLGKRTMLYANYKSVVWEIDSEQMPDNGGGGGFSVSVNTGGGFGSALELQPMLSRLKDGRHALRATLDMQVTRNGPVVGRVNSVLAGSFELHPPTASTVTVVRDPAVRARVEKAIRITQASFARWSPSQLSITVQLDRPPVGLGYDVSAVAEGKTFKLGQFACPAGLRGHGWGFGVDARGLSGSTVDIVFKPSVEAAMTSTDTFEIWDGEIVMRDVKLQSPAAATFPATLPTMTPAPAR